MRQLWEQLQTNQEAQLLALLVTLTVAYLVLRRVVRSLETLASKTEGALDDTIVGFVKKIHGIVLFFGGVTGVCLIYGIDVSPLLASAGVVGIVVGMALKETLSDMFSGVLIVVDRPFAEGDRIQLDKPSGHWGGWGDVKKVGLRRTWVENSDGVTISYPNSVLAQATVINFSRRHEVDDKPVRVRIRFAVDWSADPDQVIEIAQAAIAQGLKQADRDGLDVCPISDSLPFGKDGETKNTTPQVLIRSIWSDSLGMITPGVLMEGRYFLSDVRHRTKVRSIVFSELLKALTAHGIPLPPGGAVVPHPDGR